MSELRWTLCHKDDFAMINIPWYKDGRWKHSFVSFRLGSTKYVNIGTKKIFGLFPIYKEVKSFKIYEVLQYINLCFDAYDKTINDVLEEDKYLTEEIKIHLIRKISSDELGVHIGGNYGHDYQATSTEAYKMFGLRERQKEIEERAHNGVEFPSKLPPWAYQRENG